MARYHLGWEDVAGRPSESTGKGVRSALCLLACEAAGGQTKTALPAAAAVELVHNFSLVHDDIQDRDRERRHRPTVWANWGDAQAINAGDALLVLARLALWSALEAGVGAETLVRAAKTLDERTLEMVEGQVMDLSFEQFEEVTLGDYMAMIEKKSGALFDCALYLGGLFGSGDAETAEALGRAGRQLGVAFQVRDDMLGVWGAEERTGKQAAADIIRRKKSLPVVFALSHRAREVAEAVRRVYGRERATAEDVAEVLRALDGIGAREFCAGAAARKKEQALAALAGVALKEEAARELRQAAAFLLERDY
jgi:geranylgeranyl diphosphate synthase type I